MDFAATTYGVEACITALETIPGPRLVQFMELSLGIPSTSLGTKLQIPQGFSKSDEEDELYEEA